MDLTLYASHYDPDDAKNGIPAPEFVCEPPEPNETTFYFRIRSGHRYSRNQITVTLTRAQLESLVDAGKMALHEDSLAKGMPPTSR